MVYIFRSFYGGSYRKTRDGAGCRVLGQAVRDLLFDFFSSEIQLNVLFESLALFYLFFLYLDMYAPGDDASISLGILQVNQTSICLNPHHKPFCYLCVMFVYFMLSCLFLIFAFFFTLIFYVTVNIFYDHVGTGLLGVNQW